MSPIAQASDRFKGFMQSGSGVLRQRMFGANNERLDFIMDSFYKLDPPQRTAVLAGIVTMIGVFVLSAVFIYFSQVNNLKSDLNNTFDALHELKALKDAHQQENQRFKKVVDAVQRKTRSVRMKPDIEKVANSVGVTVKDPVESKRPLATDDPLAEKFQEVNVDLRINEVSIPKLLNFMVELEKDGKYFRVKNLSINGRFDNKLYFDSKMTIRGYVPL